MIPKKKRPKRILIDCSFINFAGQPSGIPRVVLAYVEVGYSWGQKNGVQVIPVVPTKSGIYIVRPLPGTGAPNDLKSKAERGVEQGQRSRRHIAKNLIDSVLQWGVLSVYHLCFFIISILNIKALQTLEAPLRHDIGRRYRIPFDPTDTAVDEAYISAEPGDLMFCPAYWHDIDPDVYLRLKQRGVKVVTLVHDVLPILFEQFYEVPWRYMFRDNVLASFKYADALFCVSSYTGSALKELGHRHNLPAVPIVTAYNGFEPLADNQYLERYVAGQEANLFGSHELRSVFTCGTAPYLMVGSIEPKKGHIPTVKCFEALWRAGYQRNLVIIGRRAWMSQNIVDAIETSIFYNSRLFWFYDISDFDLAYSYKASFGLIFSSIGEGFGIPMVEASHFGKPTIVLDTIISREILGDIGCYFNNSKSLVDRILELENSEYYAERCKMAESLNWPTWDNYAPKVFDTLADVYSGLDLPNVISKDPATHL